MIYELMVIKCLEEMQQARKESDNAELNADLDKAIECLISFLDKTTAPRKAA